MIIAISKPLLGDRESCGSGDATLAERRAREGIAEVGCFATSLAGVVSERHRAGGNGGPHSCSCRLRSNSRAQTEGAVVRDASRLGRSAYYL